jgi:murein DD-endopeptidase MepM/ murein hydrolase activator NlpD
MAILLFSNAFAESGYRLPFKQATSVKVTTGNTDYPHNTVAKEHYAWDFKATPNAAIVASKAGTVVFVFTDGHTISTPAGSDCVSYKKPYANDVNYVVLDHDDGKQSAYLHLADSSIKVGLGDKVNQGQELGTIGNTGWSCGTHLHFQVQNKGATWFETSVPTYFDDVSVDSGVPLIGKTYISGNSGMSFSPTSYSELLRRDGSISIDVPGRYLIPGNIVLFNGPQIDPPPLPPRSVYEADVAIAPINWVTHLISTTATVNLFSPATLGNIANISGSPSIDKQFKYPVKIKAQTALNNKVLVEGHYPFNDVKPGHWASCYIMELWRKGFVNGQDGLFRPEDPISKAEFLKIVMNAAFRDSTFTKQPASPITQLKDSFEDWQKPYVSAALFAGIIEGVLCKEGHVGQCFYPKQNITRAEAMAILVRSFRMKYKAMDESGFKDVKGNNKYYDEIITASVNNGANPVGCSPPGKPLPIISGYVDGYFRPDKAITRAEAAKIIALANNLI